MSYSAAVDQLNAMVPELYSSHGQPRRKFSLDEIRILLAALGNPQRGFPSVLIAGTNGKGSTAATLASILTASGLRTGLYTSPHLARANETNPTEPRGDRRRSFCAISTIASTMRRSSLLLDGQLPQLPSYFEILTAQAFLHFAEKRVEIAVLEVGMGGRLDATNIVDPLLSVITDISLDHTEWLGSTIAAIAREKAGILRRRGTMITLPQHPEANQVLGEVATELGVRAVNAASLLPPAGVNGDGSYCVQALDATIRVDSPLTGAHQHRNVALAIAAAAELAAKHNFRVTPRAIAEGIRKTVWPARLERIERDGQEWILDVAHNPAGVWALRAGLKEVLGGDRRDRAAVLIFSCLRDKPVAEMAQILFPLFDLVIIPPIHSSRAAALWKTCWPHAAATGRKPLALLQLREPCSWREQRAEGRPVVISGRCFWWVRRGRSAWRSGRRSA